MKHRDEVEEPLTDWLREAYEFEPVAKTIKVAKPKSAKKREEGLSEERGQEESKIETQVNWHA